MKRPIGKLRTREHVIADLSVNHVERQALLCGYAVQRLMPDYGLDLKIRTFTKKGEIQPGIVYLQVKAVDRLRLHGGQVTFPFRIERRDLVLWLAEPMPVLFIVYHARKDVAYWLYVQSHFRARKDFNLFTEGKTVSVPMATTNIVNPAAMRKFARMRDRILVQMENVSHHED